MNFLVFDTEHWQNMRLRINHHSEDMGDTWVNEHHQLKECLRWAIAQENMKYPEILLFFVGRGNLPRAMSTLSCSGWVQQECKALTTLYLGHFSGLCLQWANVRDEVMSPLGQIVGLLPCTISGESLKLSCNTAHSMCVHPWSDLCVTPTEGIVNLPKPVQTHINL